MDGLIHVYCGDGKGKTTAAAGLALRAAGCGRDVIFARFMKGNASGEIAAMKRMTGIRVLEAGENYGFYAQMSETDKSGITAEHNGILDRAEESIKHGECDMLIMDEITWAYHYRLIDRERVRRLIEEKPKALELVLTGREPEELFYAHADYITEMKCLRHPYEKGIAARRGVEY